MNPPDEKPKRILIVDDEPDLVRMLAMPFEAAGGFVVETALDGESALEKAKRFRPDAVLLDLVMPGVDGWEVHKRLRASEESRQATIVMMTAAPSKSVEERAKIEGVWRVTFKPVDVRQIITALRIELAG